MASIFVDSLPHEKILSTTYKLGALEFLCTVFPDQPRLALVLPAERVVLVLQFFKSYAYDGRIRRRAEEGDVRATAAR